MRVALVNPPDVAGYLSDRDKAGGLGTMLPIRGPHGPVVPPLDLLYSAATCKDAGAEVRILDAPAAGLDAGGVRSQIAFMNPDWVGVRLSLPSLWEDLALVRLLVRDGHRVAVFGNVIQTTHSRWLARERITALFGEPEGLWPSLLSGRQSPHIRTEGMAAPAGWALLDNLDGLPFPAWPLLHLPLYADTGRVEDMVFYLLTSRGCPRACDMCPYFVHQGGAWRYRSVESVLSEVRYLASLGARRIQVRDPNFGLDRRRLKVLCHELIRASLPVRFAIETDLELLDDECLHLLAQAGVTTIMTGLESADPECLADISQSAAAFQKNVRNIERCARIGLEVVGFLVVGADSESHRSVRTTVEIARGLPIRYSVSLMTPYPGTAFTARAVAAGKVVDPDDYARMGGTRCLISTRFMTRAEVDRAHRWAEHSLAAAWLRRRFSSARGRERWPLAWQLARKLIITAAARVAFEWDARRAAARKCRENQRPPVSSEGQAS